MTLKPLEPAVYPFFDYRRFTFSLGIQTPEGIWLSGNTAVRHDKVLKEMVVEGDLIAQADVIFEKMRLALEPAGRRLKDLTRLTRYVTRTALPQIAALDAHQAPILGTISVTTIVVERLLRDKALIEMEASVVVDVGPLALPSIRARSTAEARSSLETQPRGEASIERSLQLVTPGVEPVSTVMGLTVTAPCLPDGSSGIQIELSVASGRDRSLVYVAVHGNPTIEGIIDQCREAYRRLELLLKEAGSDLACVIKTTEFVAPAGLAAYRETAGIRREVFSEPYPAATGVVCTGFPDPRMMIAIEAVARTGQ